MQRVMRKSPLSESHVARNGCRYLQRHDITQPTRAEIEDVFAVSEFGHITGAGWERVAGMGVLPTNEICIASSPSFSIWGKKVFALARRGVGW
jgi:hypothetical protein